MSIYNYYSENISLPISDLITGRQIGKYLQLLRQSQFWSAERLREFQNARLRELIYHAYKNVPFYREILDRSSITPKDIQTVEDLQKLPILSKNDIREGIRSRRLLDSSAKLKNLERNNSSGSTGEPLQFYLDPRASSLRKATAIRCWQWMDFRLGDKILRISQIPRKGLIKKLQDISSRTIYVMANRLNQEEFEHIVRLLNKTKPKILRCYPEPLYLLAKYIEHNKLKIHKVAAINTTGSTLLPEYREFIERIFACKIYDSFSCEGGAGAFECPTHKLYHASDEYAVTEVLDSDGNPATIGRLVTTDLWNLANPFIRYDTQDVVELSDQKCSCGRELLHIERIYGRSSDILVTSGGQYLTVNNFTGLFQNLPAVDQFQILQKSPDEITVLIKVNGCYDLTVQSQVMAIMKSVIKEDLKLKIEPVDDIPLTPNGKRRFLIRDASISLNL
ncbi:MAG TPA: hypothetical protein P5031_07595 [Candidatus Syntrophosphaera sp.]|nr:hypothetical protein [Candidatus Syntrophosphaera sp.]